MPVTIKEVPNKWWAQSLTIWGIFITAASTVAPVLAPLFGLDIGAGIILTLGTEVTTLIQALGGVIGTVMAIYGRLTASLSLTRKPVLL